LLYLVRHGATDNNLSRPPRLQGSRSDPELSATGRRQAEETARLLAGRKINRVYASPLRRAMETAAAIARPHGLGVEPLAAVVECDVGRWEGLSWQEIEARDPEAFRAFVADPAARPYAGGESFDDVRKRAAAALDGLLRGDEGHGIVVVAHNVVNRAWLSGYLNIPLGQARGIPQANGGVNVLRGGPGGPKLLALNAIFHLSEWE
jgi:broad specificity phosphatase PhoE